MSHAISGWMPILISTGIFVIGLLLILKDPGRRSLCNQPIAHSCRSCGDRFEAHCNQRRGHSGSHERTPIRNVVGTDDVLISPQDAT